MFDRPINWQSQLIGCVASVVMVGSVIGSAGTTDIVESQNVEVVQQVEYNIQYPLVEELAKEYQFINVALQDSESTFRIENEITQPTYLMYVDADAVRYRSEPELSDDTTLGVLYKGVEVPVVEQEGHWCKCIVDNQVVYIHATLLADTSTVIETEDNETYTVAKSVTTVINDEEVALSSDLGRVQGPSGEETFYNLNMTKIIERMQSLGYDYEYWIREDGVKMLGDYVIVAANFEIRPLGTVVETSLGQGLVCDTGDFVKTNPTGIDIATTW